jgi:hypothetical protein
MIPFEEANHSSGLSDAHARVHFTIVYCTVLDDDNGTTFGVCNKSSTAHMLLPQRTVVTNLFGFTSKSHFINIVTVEANVNLSLSTSWRHIRGSTDIAAPILNLSTRWDWVFNITPGPLYIRERILVHTDWICRWVGLRAGLDFLKQRRVFLPADIRTPDRPTRRRNLTSTNGGGGGANRRGEGGTFPFEGGGRVFWTSPSDSLQCVYSFVNGWLNTTILPPAKVRFFNFFLPLHHPNNHLENIYIF